MYLKISGAGLVQAVLFFALVLSPVVSIPIRLASQSGLSNGQDLISRGSADSLRIQRQTRFTNGLISSASTTTTEALTDNNADGPQLVRRNAKINAKIKKGFSNMVHGLKTAGKNIVSGVKKAAKGVETGVKKAVNWVKNTGAKAAKFGLKVVESVATSASKLASAVPILRPLGKAIDGVAKGAGAASDAIKVNWNKNSKVDKRLQNGLKAMDKVHKVESFIPRRRDLSEEEAVQQREIVQVDGYYFEERDESDDIALEDREESYFDADEEDT